MPKNRINDAGFRTLTKNLMLLDGVLIEAGIFSDARANKSKNGSRADNLAYRLMIHDQGLGNNPKREVLRPASEQFGKDYSRILFKQFKRLDIAGAGKSIPKAAGQRLAAEIKLQFPKTLAKKQSTINSARQKYGGGARSTPLIQTGEMRKAVKYKVS